jgi:hypothetical protein
MVIGKKPVSPGLAKGEENWIRDGWAQGKDSVSGDYK